MKLNPDYRTYFYIFFFTIVFQLFIWGVQGRKSPPTRLGYRIGENARWLEVTKPILEAFFHACFFLEMAENTDVNSNIHPRCYQVDGHPFYTYTISDNWWYIFCQILKIINFSVTLCNPNCLNSGLLISCNFNCNLFRREDQGHPSARVDIWLLTHDIA